MLVLESCEGFQGWHMMCCKELEGCGVLYSAQALISLGFDYVAEELCIMTCHDARARSDDPIANATAMGTTNSGDGGGSQRTTLIAAATTVAGVFVVCFALTLVMWRRHQLAKRSRQELPGGALKMPFSRVRPLMRVCMHAMRSSRLCNVGSALDLVRNDVLPQLIWRCVQARGGKGDSAQPPFNSETEWARRRRERERADRAARGKAFVAPGALTGMTEHALLEGEAQPFDIVRTSSSPADHSPLEEGCGEGQSTGPHPTVRASHT